MANEDQVTEIEVLQSIYEGDPCFNMVNDTTFQYKFGEEGEKTSFLLEMQWPPEYPNIAPTFNLNAFFNNHISSSAKAVMIAALDEKASQNVGDPQGYTIFEFARYSIPDIMSTITIEPPVPLSLHLDDNAEDESTSKQESSQSSDAKSKQKKEQLTKSQKRKEWNRLDNKGEKIRGHDWIDVIKHLSQTGGSSSSHEPTYTVPVAVPAANDSD